MGQIARQFRNDGIIMSYLLKYLHNGEILMSFSFKIFHVLFVFIVMTHARTPTFFTRANSKPNKISHVVSFSVPVNQILYAQMIAPLLRMTFNYFFSGLHAFTVRIT